jgi:hypothetical protein
MIITMKKPIVSLVLAALVLGTAGQVSAQSEKNKKSRYYQNNTTAPEEFNIEGFQRTPEKKEVEKKTEEQEYDVNVRRNESDSKYYNEEKVKTETTEEKEVPKKKWRRAEYFPTTYGAQKRYNEKRAKYDKYYNSNSTTSTPAPPPPPPVASTPPRDAQNEQMIAEDETKPAKIAKTPKEPKKSARVLRKPQVEEKEIGMTPNELEYKTTVVKRRYTNLDVLCDDLDLAKVQRPVFKGICSECSADVDKIISNKNLSSLEKNYELKQCYMMRDKRLRETLDDDQYKKFLRVKDADEYLIITKDLELKDGTNR